jgi:excinuclease ABC subunit A
VCHGKRFNADTLDVRFKGRNIADVLNMTVEEASGFFAHIPSHRAQLQTMLEVGWATFASAIALTLSGGRRRESSCRSSSRGAPRAARSISSTSRQQVCISPMCASCSR